MNESFANIKCLTLTGAKIIGQAAEAYALDKGWLVSIVIVDLSTIPIYALRMTEAILASYEGAYNKAVTSLKFARPTKALEEKLAQGRLHYLTFENVLCVEGGLPILVDGTVVGGIGIGGGPSGRDAVECAKAGLKALGLG